MNHERTHNPLKAHFTEFEWDTNLRAYKSVCLCSILCAKVNIKSSQEGKIYHSVEKFEASRSERDAQGFYVA